MITERKEEKDLDKLGKREENDSTNKKEEES